jgi:hypothetical protein
MFRKKKQKWFWPSMGWLCFCMLLYWTASLFRKAAAKLDEQTAVHDDEDEEEE